MPPIFISFIARVWELCKAEEKFCVAMSYIGTALSFMWSLTSFLWKKNVRCSTENHFSQNFLYSPEIIRWSTKTKHKEKRIIWKWALDFAELVGSSRDSFTQLSTVLQCWGGGIRLVFQTLKNLVRDMFF